MINIKEKFFELQELKYRDFISSLVPTVEKDKFIGVRTPLIRRLAKEMIKSGEYINFINALPHFYFEENLLHALILSEIKEKDFLIDEIKTFADYIDNWAVSDALRPKTIKGEKDFKRLAFDLLSSNHPYAVRLGIEFLMVYFTSGNYSPSDTLEVSKIRSDEYYVNMMISWYFATLLAKRWDDAIFYIENNSLSPWCHNKAIQKARESRLISEDKKEYLRNKKIK